jgi:hypothetical protein
MKAPFTLVVPVAALLVASCAGSPPSISSATPAQTPQSPWQVYTNNAAGFSIGYPSAWQTESLPDENAGQLHRMSLTGPEGSLVLVWGIGLGGACPEGYQPVKVAQGDLPACHIQNADGTEQWTLAGKQPGEISFSASALTSDPDSSSRDLVLQILSTLSFP